VRIVVDYDRCTGNGICESAAPEHFEVQDDGSLEVLAEQVDEEHLSEVREAVAGCPTEALSLEN
jgi:ferredoxin